MMHSRGFTLVELLVVVAIVAVLMLVTVPYGGTWVRSAKLSVAKGELTQAHGFAKGAAFRNQWAAVNTDSKGNVIWSAQLDSSVSITQNATRLSCMCFDNLAQLTLGGCSACSTTGTLDIAVGADSDTLFLD